MKKISILHENLQSMKPDDYYRDVIAQPATNRKVSLASVRLLKKLVFKAFLSLFIFLTFNSALHEKSKFKQKRSKLFSPGNKLPCPA